LTQVCNGDKDRYRFGFNGQEKDNEMKGVGNSLDFGARMYDSRVGRWLSLDPLSKKFPSESNYIFAGNSPIVFIDQDGKYSVYVHYKMTRKALIKIGVDKKIATEIAHYASTYADNPGRALIFVNQVMGLFAGINPKNLSYNENKYGSYEKTEYSQISTKVSMVSIHAMKASFENISDDEAVGRALYGGEFNDTKNGNPIIIEGAMNVVGRLKGKGFHNLSKEDKVDLGMALHTIQDAAIHKGKRWVYKKDGKEEAKEIGGKNEHPYIGCITGENIEDAKTSTENVVKQITSENPETSVSTTD
jgi:RHS repeat-associated protein